MYVFTNTITTIPFGYYVKVEVIADSGTTGSLSPTNGGYIMDIGSLTEAIDVGTGAYNPGQITIAFRNLGSIFSTNVFTDAIVAIELRIWLSYDAGSTYENFFAGFIDYQTRDYSERDTSDDTIRIYRVKANSAIMTLRDVSTALFTSSPPANLVTETNVTGYGVWSDTVHPLVTASSIDFAYLKEVLLSAASNIPFISGAYAPTIAVSVDGGGLTVTNGTISSDFDDLAVVWDIPAAFYAAGYASFGNPDNTGDTQYRASIYSADNMLIAIKQIAESFMLVPIPRMTESGGAYTYTIYFEPLNSTATSGTIAGSLGEFYKKDGKFTQWYDCLQLSTVNMPVQESTTSTYGGKTREFKNRFLTCRDMGGGGTELYYLSKVEGRGLGLAPEWAGQHGFGGQLLFVYSGTNMVNVRQIKLRTYQSYRTTSTTNLDAAWYGVHDSIYDLVITNADRGLVNRKERRSIQGRYKTLIGNDLWDFRVGRDTTIDTKTFRLYKTDKNILRNSTDVDYLEEA